MIRLALALLLAATALLLSPLAAGAAAPSPACAAIAAKAIAARDGGDIAAFAPIRAESTAPASMCDERATHCIGNLLALGHLDAAYAAGDAGKDDAAVREIATAGLAYGSPWQLEAALGDIDTSLGQATGDAGHYSSAAWAYQQALIGAGEAQVCGDFGEPPLPNAAQLDTLYRHLSAALLLADPLQVATTRCAPCQWLFLTGTAGFTPAIRPLPVTFPAGSAEPTTTGREAVEALLQCLKVEDYSSITLSGHTDPDGSPADNLALSKRRLESIRVQLVAGGYGGAIVLDPKGESEPFPADEGFSPREQWRMDRRIELRDTQGGMPGTCQ